MTKRRTNQKSFYYQKTHAGGNYEVKKFWCPGNDLNDQDVGLLACVKAFHEANGYVPSRKELSEEEVKKLKARFRTWKNVLLAAGLPAMNDAETQLLRQKAKVQE